MLRLKGRQSNTALFALLLISIAISIAIPFEYPKITNLITFMKLIRCLTLAIRNPFWLSQNL